MAYPLSIDAMLDHTIIPCTAAMRRGFSMPSYVVNRWQQLPVGIYQSSNMNVVHTVRKCRRINAACILSVSFIYNLIIHIFFLVFTFFVPARLVASLILNGRKDFFKYRLCRVCGNSAHCQFENRVSLV